METWHRPSAVKYVYNPGSPGHIHVTQGTICKWALVSVLPLQSQYTEVQISFSFHLQHRANTGPSEYVVMDLFMARETQQ